MGHKSVHIECKQGYWYYRRRIPRDLQHFFPRKQIRFSLKTKSLDDAVMLARLKGAEIDKTFSLLRCGVLTDNQRDSAVALLFPEKNPPVTSCKQAIEGYLVDRKPGLSQRTQMDYEYFAGVIKEKYGSQTLVDISRNDLITYREQLAAERAPATVNKYLSWLQAFFTWCVESKIIENNPAVGITRIKDNARRDRFAVSELAKMFQAISRYKDSAEYPQRYWVPMISLFMGLRLTEALQLDRSDIHKKDGVWCIWVNASGNRTVKTKNSERYVPIHPALIEAGFLSYLNNRVGCLWPIDLSRKRLSNAFSCWFSQQVRPTITGEKGKTFHSLRHTFVDELKQAGVEEQYIAELVGHSRGSLTMERYGKKYLPQTLYEQIIKFDSINTIQFSAHSNASVG